MTRSKLLKAYLLRATASLVSAVALCGSAAAQVWEPSGPLKLIVPYTPGAGADITARLFAERLATALNQTVIVENRGGAGGLIGTEAGAHSPPDGQTLVWGSDVAFTIHPQLMKVRYDPVKDFAPVSLLVNLPMVLAVNPKKVEAKYLKELIALVKANPGKYTIASAGNGSSHHLAAELFKHNAGLDLLHIPYRGAAEGLTDLVGGQVDMMFISPASALTYLKSGRLTPIGMSIGPRLAALPDVPTLAEAGLPDFKIGIWMGILYPAGTPTAAIERINAESSKILQIPEVQARIAELGYTPGGGKPEVLVERIASDMVNYGKLIKDANIKLQH